LVHHIILDTTSARVIHAILGGLAAGGISNSQRKKYAHKVHVDDLLRKKTKVTEVVSFLDADLKEVQVPHDDAW